jgi:hypothetical protein
MGKMYHNPANGKTGGAKERVGLFSGLGFGFSVLKM